jgi:hypothetical protein
MTPVMPPKKSGTHLRSQGSADGPTDSRLTRGAVIVVGGDMIGRNALKVDIARALGPEVAAFPDLDALQAHIHPRSTGRAGRPPVRGFLLDWGLGSPRGAPLLEVLKWLDGVYPRTPIVTYTSAPDLAQIHPMCARGQHAIVPLGRKLSAAHPLQQAVLALVCLSIHETAILARDGLTDRVLQSMEDVWFKFWEEQRLDARRWLIDQLPLGTEAAEYHLRTIEAYFDSLTRGELAYARGVAQSTMAQHEKEVASLWGEPLESLKQRWERCHHGRGAAASRSRLAQAMGARPAAADPARESEPPRPSGPRQPSARRSR